MFIICNAYRQLKDGRENDSGTKAQAAGYVKGAAYCDSTIPSNRNDEMAEYVLISWRKCAG